MGQLWTRKPSSGKSGTRRKIGFFGSRQDSPIPWLPVEQVAEIVKACIELRKQLVEDVYQIIGISDIMRGASDPQETEGAQQLKAQYGGTRVRDRQNEIARFC